MNLKEASMRDLVTLPIEVVEQMLTQSTKRVHARAVEYQGVHWLVDRVKVARAAAQARGHEGRLGGWIYTAEGRPICQGWIDYYHQTSVASWVRSQRTSREDDEPARTSDAEDRYNRGGW
jgi:hypothetical protein